MPVDYLQSIKKAVRLGGFFVVIFFCCAKSDMIADGNRDIETFGFSDILFAIKLPKAIKLVKDKYNCEAI